MDIKNLKVNKKTLICTGSWLVLTPLVVVGVAKIGGDKIISKDDTYEVHRIDMTEYSKDGILENDKYLSERPEYDNCIILKRPYEENNDKIERKVIGIDASSYSQVEIDYILDNLDNQDLLLSQDYIQNIIDKYENDYNQTVTYSYYEYSSVIPDDNNYEISYITIDGEDKNDIKNIKYTKLDRIINNALICSTSLLIALGSGILIYSYYDLFGSKEKDNNKVKTKKK